MSPIFTRIHEFNCPFPNKPNWYFPNPPPALSQISCKSTPMMSGELATVGQEPSLVVRTQAMHGHTQRSSINTAAGMELRRITTTTGTTPPVSPQRCLWIHTGTAHIPWERWSVMTAAATRSGLPQTQIGLAAAIWIAADTAHRPVISNVTNGSWPPHALTAVIRGLISPQM